MHVEVFDGTAWQTWVSPEPITTDELANELVRVLEHVWGVRARVVADPPAESVLFHPAGPPTYPAVLPGQCPRCAGDVYPVELHGSLAYFECRGCKTAFTSIEITVEAAPATGR